MSLDIDATVRRMVSAYGGYPDRASIEEIAKAVEDGA